MLIKLKSCLHKGCQNANTKMLLRLETARKKGTLLDLLNSEYLVSIEVRAGKGSRQLRKT